MIVEGRGADNSEKYFSLTYALTSHSRDVSSSWEIFMKIGTRRWNQTPREVAYEIGALIAFVVMTGFIALGFLLIRVLYPR